VKRLTEDELILGDDYVFYHQGQPFTGVTYDTREDGSLWSEETYVRGVKHGPARTLFPGGQIQRQSHYKMGLAHGWNEEWYSDGRIKSRRLYELAVPVEEQEFDREGKLIRERRIDPNSDEFRRLSEKRKNEEQRVERIYARYGRPNPAENQDS
jgi:antitoxin component YwqK of YwqJK toxin-antitoxin module